MIRALAPLALLAVASTTWAQASGPTGIRVHLGYGFSPSFDNAGGDSATLQGPEIGVAIPIGNFLGQELLLEPSFFGGGRLRSGDDSDSDVYRITAFLHRDFARGIGGRLGVGYSSSSRARGGGFDGTSGLVVDLGVEVPFQLRQLKGIQPYLDVHGVFSGEERLSGFFVGVGTKL